MEVYTLDESLRRIAVIDRFESMIWTERYADIGDFELKIHSSSESRALLVPETRLAINNSYRVMEVETVVDEDDSEGRSILTVTGRSLEKILENRVAKESWLNTTQDPSWELTGTPAAIARTIFDSICRQGILSSKDIIPFLQTGSLLPAGTIAEPDQPITIQQALASVFEAVQSIAKTYGLGFRLIRNFDNSQLFFDIYTGNDRTSMQDNYPAVIFSPGLDTLSGVSELSSTASLKNVAYVFSPLGVVEVYADGVDPNISGLQRRVLLVDASDVNQNSAQLTAILKQKGVDALAQNRSLRAFDGEIPQNSPYRYDRDYRLGDLVEMRSDTGQTSNMRVTEQIFVSDSSGDRAYPTLAVDTFVMPGTWNSRDFDETWDEATDFWDTAI